MLDTGERTLSLVEERLVMRKTLASFSKALLFIVLCAGLAFLLAAGVVFLKSDKAAESAAPTPAASTQSGDRSQSARAPQSGAAATPQAQANNSAIDVTIPTDTVEQALAHSSEVLAAPEDAIEPGNALASTALEDLQATAEEWGLLGYRQEGQAVLSDVTVLNVSDTGETMEVLACVDSSNVRVVDENGKEVSDEQAPARSRSIFELQFIEGKWKVTNQSFPEDPEC